ncbi:MAG TPA: shikimate dehydrogenase [Gemmatimonadaceae bacterium]|nr:shikimate dehydrogenase [Gemmatimonadaceae bacterium]
MIKRPGRLVLLGRSLGHSLSPLFQNAALEKAKLPLRYETLDVPASALEETLEQLAAEGAAGNVTIPYKEKMYESCDRLTAVARDVGAVNTFWFERGELVGDNTDVFGFNGAVRQLLEREPTAITVGVLGAGGAAAAVVAAVSAWPASRVLLSNRTTSRAEALCERFSSVARVSDAKRLASESDLVVNATSIGLRDDDVPLEPSTLRGDAAVLDLVYRRGETAWVRAARARGLRAGDGLVMLIEQGAAAFERWFGFAPDRDAMWSAVR